MKSVATNGIAHLSLVIANSKVVPIKWLTMPHLELCGDLITAQFLHHVSQIFNLVIYSLGQIAQCVDLAQRTAQELESISGEL